MLGIEEATGARLVVYESGEVALYAPTRPQYEAAHEAVMEVEGRSIKEGQR